MNKLIALIAMMLFPVNAFAAEPCEESGPQTPRDITSYVGENIEVFPMAPDYSKMNLCNIHLHKNAEHRGPDFLSLAPTEKYSGYICNETSSLTAEQLVDPMDGKGAFKDVKPGDTVEVHWVHTTCNIQPGPTLSSCLSDDCVDPKLRVETQVFLLVNDKYALDFNDYMYSKELVNGMHQAKAIPQDQGKPFVFRGSTTGPKYSEEICSPANVTWSVRPQCAKLDISSLHKWAEGGNIFNESKPHGVREIVDNVELLAPIIK